MPKENLLSPAARKKSGAYTDMNQLIAEMTATTDEPMKRLNVDIPASMHRALKMRAASRGIKLRELVQEIFGNYFLPPDLGEKKV